MVDANAQSTEATRRKQRSVTGVVVSDKMAKTITVEVTRLVKHPVYGKYVRRRARYKAHDETSDAHLGDTVVVVETKPLSRTKRWRLQKVLARATER